MPKQNEWERIPLEGEQTITVEDQRQNEHVGFMGIAGKQIVLAYLKNGYMVVTCTDIKSRKSDTRVPIAKNKELDPDSVNRCARAWRIQHFPVVAFHRSTPTGSANALREQAMKQYDSNAAKQVESAMESAQNMRQKASELIGLYHLYIAIERRIEGTGMTVEEEIQQDQTIDPEVAQKLIKYHETVAYLRAVLTTIVHERFNGQFNIVDAYQEIGPPSQEQARVALDTAILVSELGYQVKQIAPDTESLSVEIVADLCIAAIFMNNACWSEKTVSPNHAALSARNYSLMRKRIPKLPDVVMLIRDHSILWHSDWVYRVAATTTTSIDDQPNHTTKFEYRFGKGPYQQDVIKKAILDSIGLISLDPTQIAFDVDVNPIDRDHQFRVTMLSIAERLIENQRSGMSALTILDQLSKLMQYPDYPEAAILSPQLPLFSLVLASAAREYRLFPKGAIVLFTNGTGEGHREGAIRIEVEGGIAIVINDDPVEFILISHEKLDKAMLLEPANMREFTTPTLGKNKLPKKRFVSFRNGTSKQVFQSRGNVLGILDQRTLTMFLKEYEEQIAQARAIIQT